jgi:predicted DNA-binding protein (UPF0251 family)
MSPRIIRPRKVLNPPVIKGFKPYGSDSGNKKSEPVLLLYEEYEALRLCDYDGFNHHQSSQIMNVSRPTFTRIYASARQKIAKAFVEGRQISIEGGKIYFDSNWYHCRKCMCYFNNPDKENDAETCPLCGSDEINPFDFENALSKEDPKPHGDICFCPVCGFELEHEHGMPCSQQMCPKCRIQLKRKLGNHCRTIKYK